MARILAALDRDEIRAILDAIDLQLITLASVPELKAKADYLRELRKKIHAYYVKHFAE
jgi:hypothetical protein